MARRRYSRRYRRRSSRWSPNMLEIPTTTLQAVTGTFYQSFVLSTNPVQANTAVSQTYTVKRIEINFYIDQDAVQNVEYIEDVAVYIMFVPQGMSVTQDYNLQHPEYIMAYKYLGSPYVDFVQGGNAGQQFQPRRISSRLSRKLNTGDSIVLFIKGTNVNTTTSVFDIHGLVRWWTKAN